MLIGLLGLGFSNRCKSLSKPVKTRIHGLRKGREATQKYLMTNIAQAIANRHYVNAYEKTDEYISEVTRLWCYDFMEEACELILKKLPAMEKRSECPEECIEAVGSLVFASARFSNFSELRELTNVFTEKYGSSLQRFVNQEFVEKLVPKPPTIERKIKALEDIASEFSIKWDSKDVSQKIFNPSTSLDSGGFEQKISNPSASLNSRGSSQKKPNPSASLDTEVFDQKFSTPSASLKSLCPLQVIFNPSASLDSKGFNQKFSTPSALKSSCRLQKIFKNSSCPLQKIFKNSSCPLQKIFNPSASLDSKGFDQKISTPSASLKSSCPLQKIFKKSSCPLQKIFNPSASLDSKGFDQKFSTPSASLKSSCPLQKIFKKSASLDSKGFDQKFSTPSASLKSSCPLQKIFNPPASLDSCGFEQRIANSAASALGQPKRFGLIHDNDLKEKSPEEETVTIIYKRSYSVKERNENGSENYEPNKGREVNKLIEDLGRRNFRGEELNGKEQSSPERNNYAITTRQSIPDRVIYCGTTRSGRKFTQHNCELWSSTVKEESGAKSVGKRTEFVNGTYMRSTTIT